MICMPLDLTELNKRTFPSAFNHLQDLDSLEARRLQEEAVLLSKQVQHLAIECLNAGVLSPAELSLGGPWISPSLATAPPLSPGELTALNVEVHPRHANGTADKAQQLSAITQSMQASAAARAGNRSSKAQQGRSAGGRGRGRELLDEHQAVIEAAEEQTQGMPDPSRELYLRAVALGPPAFKGIDDHRGRVLGIRCGGENQGAGGPAVLPLHRRWLQSLKAEQELAHI
jgi:hypothetical protein